jgi:hypothetical protein
MKKLCLLEYDIVWSTYSQLNFFAWFIHVNVSAYSSTLKLEWIYYSETWLTFNGLLCAATQKTELFIATVVRISVPTQGRSS